MQVQGSGHGGRVAAMLDEGKRGLLHTSPACGSELVERLQAPLGKPGGEAAGLEEEQLGQVLLGLDEAIRLDRPGLDRSERGRGDRPGLGELRSRDGRSERRGHPAGRPLELRPPLRSGRAGDEGAADPPNGGDERIRREPATDAGEVLLGDRQRGGAPRQPPPRRLRRGPDLSVGGRRVTQQQGEELTAAALALSLLLALGLRISLHRVGGELIDVGEDRLGEQSELLGVGPAAAGSGGDTAPGDAGTDPVGGLERVERAALPQLGPAQANVDVPTRLPPRGGVADQRNELAQRLADAGADRDAERALERTGVLGDLTADARQDLLGHLGQLGLDRVGEGRRQGVPGLGFGSFCHSDDKKSREELAFRLTLCDPPCLRCPHDACQQVRQPRRPGGALRSPPWRRSCCSGAAW